MFKEECFRQTRGSCLKDWKKGIQAKQENITVTTDKLKKKNTKSEELEGSWARWTATILDKDIYILP